MRRTVTKTEKVLWILLYAVIFVAIIGASILVWQGSTSELAIFELLAFSVSITALVLATLSAINNVQQMRTTRSLLKEMRAAIRELQALNHENEMIKRKVYEGYNQSKGIVHALEEAGLTEAEQVQKTQQLKKTQKKRPVKKEK